MKKLLALLENRADLSIIYDWIERGSSVLDLGCGDGTLLNYLINNKSVRGMGIEINLNRITSCIEKGIPVIEHDLNDKFTNIKDKAYDYVILSQTIQELLYPDLVIDEILRIGKYGIVSFPNFGYYQIRLKLFMSGRTNTLSHNWYNTPNIHLLTLSDFTDFCTQRSIKIIKIFYIRGNKHMNGILFPNLFSEACVALIKR
jgi:methionine biosynthesis protein MetW